LVILQASTGNVLSLVLSDVIDQTTCLYTRDVRFGSLSTPCRHPEIGLFMFSMNLTLD